jgi:hypothetical protein
MKEIASRSLVPKEFIRTMTTPLFKAPSGVWGNVQYERNEYRAKIVVRLF